MNPATIQLNSHLLATGFLYIASSPDHAITLSHPFLRLTRRVLG